MKNPPLQGWGCVEPHYYKNSPHHARPEEATNVQEASTTGEVARSMPRTIVLLEDHQAYYQRTMIKLEGKLFNQSISLLVDVGAILSYVSPKVVGKCCLQTHKFKIPWMVQLATGSKRRVNAKVPNCSIEIGSQ